MGGGAPGNISSSSVELPLREMASPSLLVALGYLALLGGVARLIRCRTLAQVEQESCAGRVGRHCATKWSRQSVRRAVA